MKLTSIVESAGLQSVQNTVYKRACSLFNSFGCKLQESGKISLRRLRVEGCGYGYGVAHIARHIPTNEIAGIIVSSYDGSGIEKGANACFRLCDGSQLELVVSPNIAGTPQKAWYFSGDNLIAVCEHSKGGALLPSPRKNERWSICDESGGPIATITRTDRFSLNPFVFTFEFVDGRKPWFRVSSSTGLLPMSKETLPHNLKEMFGARDMGCLFQDETPMTQTEEEIFVLTNVMFRSGLYDLDHILKD